VKVCPEKVITHGEDGIHIDRTKCSLCGECVNNCLPEALQISGKKMTVDEVWRVVKKDADYYEASGGGVTASGGEILVQADFVAALFKKCKEAGYHNQRRHLRLRRPGRFGKNPGVFRPGFLRPQAHGPGQA
jgi:pyruvate formate lyase activating enzyme